MNAPITFRNSYFVSYFVACDARPDHTYLCFSSINRISG